MNNDINAKINNILSGMNPQEMQQIVQMAKKSGIVSKLTPAERERIINEFSKLSTKDIKRKLSNFDPSDLSKLSTDELIKKIQNL